ncbi:hypothetical protein Kpho02_31550 [Kitasatospora phosalacinea]|uniref:Uncharacterized protein n=1 Tax=Kitasatospora phosalacinea TaxID=2065 RepID=A0A9W6Q8S1_9ACTN|nr:hypothetical protein [Kitasatospora phosalacinea]GLW70856.1 hypothetical protein Kpho02_31550 [Kitasatospora phosalacinea]
MDHDDTRTEPGPADRARWIADALHEPTGRRPLLEHLPGGSHRVTLRTVAHPDAAVATAVLRVLGAADRFGHRDRRQQERLWAEVDPPSAPPAGR